MQSSPEILITSSANALEEVTPPPIRVLYLHHCGAFGGSSRSMMEMIRMFPAGKVEPLVLTQRGTVEQALHQEGIPYYGVSGVSQFDNTRYSHYRGWRWLVLLRELAYLPSTVRGLLAVRRRFGIPDLIHVNEVTQLPGIWLAARLFKNVPIVMHARSVMNTEPCRRTQFMVRLLSRFVKAVVAIDNTVAKSLPAKLPVKVIHNGLRRPAILRVADAAPRAFTVAMVGTLARVKGCIEFVQAAAICKQRGLDIRFVFVGASARASTGLRQRMLKKLGLSQEIEDELSALIATHQLEGTVHFHGFTTDLAEIYTAIDVICFPSHYDAPGRPIFEAAFFAVPSIAAVTRPMEDTIIPEKTGIAIRPRSAEELANAIQRLHDRPDERIRMGI
ncbi:MAG TPA: glycosyltransferase, partial [Burkholderiales bacterium]|nr:glycosyltransferase [Burkholderiales bacterium]